MIKHLFQWHLLETDVLAPDFVNLTEVRGACPDGLSINEGVELSESRHPGCHPPIPP
jgi:hypothetical protein